MSSISVSACPFANHATFHPLVMYRTQGLVSSAEALGVARETEGKSTDKAKHSPVVDRAALYRFVSCCLHLRKSTTSLGFSGRAGTFLKLLRIPECCNKFSFGQ